MAKYEKPVKIERIRVFSTTKDHSNLSQFEHNAELMESAFEWKALRLKFQETGSKFVEEEAQALKQSILSTYGITVYDLVRLAKMGE